jgi:hypothetical protein
MGKTKLRDSPSWKIDRSRRQRSWAGRSLGRQALGLVALYRAAAARRATEPPCTPCRRLGPAGHNRSRDPAVPSSTPPAPGATGAPGECGRDGAVAQCQCDVPGRRPLSVSTLLVRLGRTGDNVPRAPSRSSPPCSFAAAPNRSSSRRHRRLVPCFAAGAPTSSALLRAA